MWPSSSPFSQARRSVRRRREWYSTGLPPAASRRGDTRRLYADGVTNELDPTALRSARLAKGLTQKQLSETIGVAVEGRVSTWERGRATPHPQQLRALADALGVSIKSMLRPVAVQQYNLRRLRIEAGLNIEELAARIDVPVPTLKRWEQGLVRKLSDRAPTRAIARALGVDIDLVRDALDRSSRE